MFFKKFILYLFGFYEIEVEGLFIQRFMNLATSKKIVIISSKIEKSTVLNCKVYKKDIDKIKEIVEKVGCLLSIKKEDGVPYVLKKYRKRKVFAITSLVIAIFIFINSLFIWNVDLVVEGNGDTNKINKDEIYTFLEENDIEKGILKKDVNKKEDEVINKIRLKFENINWIGFKIKGTNLIVTVQEGILKEDNQDVCDYEKSGDGNIYASKDGKISKLTVLSGTARKGVGDDVKKGDLIVEGVMEGTYTGIRNVEAKAEIFIEKKIVYIEESLFEIEEKEKTGNIENKVEIYINNFKINFNKTLLNFENYDTIRENKIVKLFSNYYLPIEIVLLKNEEWKLVKRKYETNELTEILFSRIEERFHKEYDVSCFEKIDVEKQTRENNGKLILTVTYNVQEKMKAKKD